MLNVTDETRAAYQLDGVHKKLIVKFPDLNLTLRNESIVTESLELKQSIQEGDALECVGCIASSLSIELADVTQTFVRGNKIEVYIQAGDTETIPLFTGYVDSAKKQANRRLKKVQAYDILYRLSGQAGIPGENKKRYDITDWFNNHGSCTVEELLYEICNDYGVDVVSTDDPFIKPEPLLNGHIITHCGQFKKANNLSVLGLLKNICQLNACFGYITNDGRFSWKYLGGSQYASDGYLYPSDHTYPSDNLWPTDFGWPNTEERDREASNFLGWYRDVQYEDFIVQPIQRVIVRDSSRDDEDGNYNPDDEMKHKNDAEYGKDGNKYIIQGNILIYDQDQYIKLDVAKNVWDKLNSIGYVPFRANNQGLPYMECGDKVSYIDLTANPDTGKKIDFYIFSRTLKGIQYITDSYTADGDEFQHEFLTDGSGLNGNDIEDKLEDEYYDKDEVDELLKQTLYRIEAVEVIPEHPEDNTLYVIKGVCRVVQEKIFVRDNDEEVSNEI